MAMAWIMTIAVTRPLILTLTGSVTPAKIRTMAPIFDSDYGHGQDCCLSLTGWLF